MLSIHDMQGGWQLRFDPEAPIDSEITRADGKFFKVIFCSQRYGQPLVLEATDDSGIAGRVLPVVRLIDGQWKVAVTRNERPANFYLEPLVEGARRSASNDNPFLTASGEAIAWLPGFIYSNSARIAGKIQVGVVDVTDSPDFSLPENSWFMSFRQFFDESTDSMTKAALGHFMVSILHLV